MVLTPYESIIATPLRYVKYIIALFEEEIRFLAYQESLAQKGQG